MVDLRPIADRVLQNPLLFDLQQRLVGAPKCHEKFIREYVAPHEGEAVLDIGCGVGASVPYLPTSVTYVGIDIDANYVAKAQRMFRDRGRFICADVGEIDQQALGRFDRAFSFGVLHHLDDPTAHKFFQLARRCVKPGGQFFTIDPCIRPNDHPIARYLISQDRGRHVRNETQYRALAQEHGQVTSRIATDLLNVPYTQLLMTVTF
jgi:SAM-dependent methyltransferase